MIYYYFLFDKNYEEYTTGWNILLSLSLMSKSFLKEFIYLCFLPVYFIQIDTMHYTTIFFNHQEEKIPPSS